MLTCDALSRSITLQFFQNAFGCPASSGKNREAGENPARSRHCEDRRFGKRRCKSQETCPDAVCSFRTPRARGFWPPWEFSSRKKIPSPACHFRVAEIVTGF